MEIWKDIPSLPDYQVSNTGLVRSLRFGKVRLLTLGQHPCGYIQTRIGQNGKGITLRVHRLVAEAFIPNPNNLAEIDHIDRNPANNQVSNLRWATRRDNLLNRQAHYEPRYAILQRGNSYQVRFSRGIYLPSCSTLEEAIVQRDEWLKNHISR